MAFRRINASAVWVDVSEAVPTANFVGGFSRFIIEGALPPGELPAGDVTRFGGWDVHNLFLRRAKSTGHTTDVTGVLFANDGSKLLPQSCIESAEHVIRCKRIGRFESWDPQRSEMPEPPTPTVTADFGSKRINISKEDFTDRSKLPFHNYFRYSDITVSDGIMVAYSQNKARPRGTWSCHAVAVVAKEVDGQGLIIIDIYADDDNEDTPLIRDWTMSYLTSMAAFAAHYNHAVGGLGSSSMARLIPSD